MPTNKKTNGLSDDLAKLCDALTIKLLRPIPKDDKFWTIWGALNAR